MNRLPDWMYAQSAVIPFKRDGDKVMVLLVTSRRSGRWVLPKGVIEIDMSPAASAAKEALEEAGVVGEVDERNPLGTYTYEKWGGTCSVEVFGMRVTEELTDWPEAHTRIRRWMTIDEAKRKVKEAKLKAILRRFEGQT